MKGTHEKQSSVPCLHCRHPQEAPGTILKFCLRYARACDIIYAVDAVCIRVGTKFERKSIIKEIPHEQDDDQRHRRQRQKVPHPCGLQRPHGRRCDHGREPYQRRAAHHQISDGSRREGDPLLPPRQAPQHLHPRFRPHQEGEKGGGGSPRRRERGGKGGVYRKSPQKRSQEVLFEARRGQAGGDLPRQGDVRHRPRGRGRAQESRSPQGRGVRAARKHPLRRR